MAPFGPWCRPEAVACRGVIYVQFFVMYALLRSYLELTLICILQAGHSAHARLGDGAGGVWGPGGRHQGGLHNPQPQLRR